MATLPNEIILKLDDETMQIMQTLRDHVDLLSAHVENLIQRVLVLEEGHDFEYMVHCHDCCGVTGGMTLDEANAFAENHAAQPTATGSRQYHAPYVVPQVKR